MTVGVCSARGGGPNKKLAKRAAAETLLQELGYSPKPPGNYFFSIQFSHLVPFKLGLVVCLIVLSIFVLALVMINILYFAFACRQQIQFN